jgi:long-chain fatty acid transport protein
MSCSTRSAKTVLAVALAAASFAPALAADGYFANGVGARHKALAGAGVADSNDATAISLNPAGLANVGNEAALAISALNYHRGYSGTGTGGVTASGEHLSENEWFPVPNFAINRRVSLGFADAIALSVYGNGGINTQYADVPNANCPPGYSGLNCGGELGLNLTQTFVSVAFAKTLAPGFSLGVAPILARQQFRLMGVGAFAAFSADPAHFSNQGTFETWGTGVKAGLEMTIAPGLKFGIAGTSAISMGRVANYAGVLAEQGKMNIPGNAQLGVSYQIRPDLKIFADYRHIWYASVAALGNPSTPVAPFGFPNGPGFGARDLDVVKFGAEWQRSTDLTLRAGYAFGAPMFRSPDADLNLLTGGAARHHITTGMKYKLTERLDLEASGMYSPRTSLSGEELLNPARNITIHSRQYELTVGAVYRFDTERPGTSLK